MEAKNGLSNEVVAKSRSAGLGCLVERGPLSSRGRNQDNYRSSSTPSRGMSARRLMLRVTLLSFLATPVCAFAQGRGDMLVKRGAPLRDVLAAWGEPEERIERAVKRELVWRYKDGSFVVFKDGAVSSFKTLASDRIEQARKVAKEESEKKVAALSEESQDFLRDIVREIPSSKEGGGPDIPPPPSDPNLAGLIPNAIPRRPGSPPGIAPGAVLSDEEADEVAPE